MRLLKRNETDDTAAVDDTAAETIAGLRRIVAALDELTASARPEYREQLSFVAVTAESAAGHIALSAQPGGNRWHQEVT